MSYIISKFGISNKLILLFPRVRYICGEGIIFLAMTQQRFVVDMLEPACFDLIISHEHRDRFVEIFHNPLIEGMNTRYDKQ